MNKDQNTQPDPIRVSDDLVIIDETNSTRDTTVRPLQGADRKRAEQYWADLKKYSPQEYEELMKRSQSKP